MWKSAISNWKCKHFISNDTFTDYNAMFNAHTNNETYSALHETAPRLLSQQAVKDLIDKFSKQQLPTITSIQAIAEREQKPECF